MPPADSTQILALARTDAAAARSTLASLSAEEQAAILCGAPIEGRRHIFAMLAKPAEVIPLLPEIELSATAKAIGLSEAGALLRHATASQIVAALDLDAWAGHDAKPALVAAWLDGLASAGDNTLMRGLESLDVELVALYLHDRIEVFQKENEEDWEPPAGGQTVDGQVYFCARAASDDVALPFHILKVAFTEDRSLYLRLIQLILWEPAAELEDWARRWREGRLIDMGFPRWEQAMAVYGFLRPEERMQMPPSEHAPGLDAVTLARAKALVVPQRGASEHSLFEAIDGLGDEPRRDAYVAFLELTNKVLIADRAPLGDIEAMRVAMEKVARFASQALEAVADSNDVEEVEVLRRLTLERLFRVGANLQDRPERPRS